MNGMYSVVGLVCPRTEEQISGTISSKKIKRPSISGWEGLSYCPKYSKLCYDQFGGRLEASNPPHVFSPRMPGAYWGDLSCAGGAAVFVGSAHSIFLNFVEIVFLLNSIAICLLSTSTSLHYWCTLRLHSGQLNISDVLTVLYLLTPSTSYFSTFIFFNFFKCSIAMHCILLPSNILASNHYKDQASTGRGEW